jgi:hypothetical protein
MTTPPDATRQSSPEPCLTQQCPTRQDGADPLIAHGISQGTCMERQRRHYHKCYTCALRNPIRPSAGRAPALDALLGEAPSRERPPTGPLTP